MTRILVVDDDPDVRDVIVALLEANDFEALGVADGGSMRKRLAAVDVPIDAVILDSVMPTEPGTLLAEYAKGLGIPVLLVSGNPEILACANTGQFRFLKKPFSAAVLVDAVRNIIGRD